MGFLRSTWIAVPLTICDEYRVRLDPLASAACDNLGAEVGMQDDEHQSAVESQINVFGGEPTDDDGGEDNHSTKVQPTNGLRQLPVHQEVHY
jgi:hypothetical protein